jgi:hypothetical protein
VKHQGVKVQRKPSRAFRAALALLVTASLLAITSPASAAGETVTLTPSESSNLIGTEHCVTAALQDSTGSSLGSIDMIFNVDGVLTTKTTESDGTAVLCYTGPNAPDVDTIDAFADFNGDGTHTSGEPIGSASKWWQPGIVEVTPSEASNLVGTEHCVTATLSADATFGGPDDASLGGIDMIFRVEGVNTGTVTSGTTTTESDGTAVFCYTGPENPEFDNISAFADLDGNDGHSGFEPMGNARKFWAQGELIVDPFEASNLVGTEHCVTATLSADTDPYGAPDAPLGGFPVKFFIAGVNTGTVTSGTTTTESDGTAVFCYTGPENPEFDNISAFADLDGNDGHSGFEPMGNARKFWAQGMLDLSPLSATNLVGTEHCVTATLSGDTAPSGAPDAPVGGFAVHFSVTSNDSEITTATTTTEGDGKAVFCYTGPASAREDRIFAFADIDGNGSQDPIEPDGGATKTWATFGPVVGPITAPVDPVPVGTQISASAEFTDADFGTHTAIWDWGDGTQSAGVITESTVITPGLVTGEHTYSTPGIYTITVTVDDGSATGSSVYRYVVVYDPNGGFVTGGGWIQSPAGSFAADPNVIGRANFGFESKYRKGSTKPTGVTEFQFRAGDLNFHSHDYQWLVVNHARAQYKGVGTINGSGSFGFLLTAIDGQLNGGGGTDRFRIKIWDTVSGDAVYDNKSGEPDSSDAATALGGGSVIIHKP